MFPANSASLIEALHTAEPAADRADKLHLYGQFVGAWAFDATIHRDDGTRHEDRGEIHFGWVLAGRAIQDVWILPSRAERAKRPPEAGIFYGTTLRVYDPGIDAWHILWSDPERQLYRRMLGRAVGVDIVQHGEDETGAKVRWSFTDIRPGSFRWTAERSPDGGAGWTLLVEFRARRTR